MMFLVSNEAYTEWYISSPELETPMAIAWRVKGVVLQWNSVSCASLVSGRKERLMSVARVMDKIMVGSK